jgi:hypothetical protein
MLLSIVDWIICQVVGHQELSILCEIRRRRFDHIWHNKNQLTHYQHIHNNIKLNLTYEEHSSIEFLDPTKSHEHKKLKNYRKPTTTDTTINFFSNHPIEQKMAAYRYHITRLHSLPLDSGKKQKEWKTIQTVAKNNSFPQQLLQKIN